VLDDEDREAFVAEAGKDARQSVDLAVGGGGLGDIIVNQPQYRLAGVLAAAFVIAALAFATEVLLALVQRALTPRAMRAQARAPAIGPATREMTA